MERSCWLRPGVLWILWPGRTSSLSTIRWLEEAGRKDLIGHLTPENFNTRRILETLRHLGSMSGAFLSAYQARYGSADEQAGTKKKVPQLTGAKKLLDAVSTHEPGR